MKKNNKGQSLIEAVIALGITGIIIAATTIAVITGINNANYAKNQNLATQYAQQAIDIVHQQSQSDWYKFSTTVSTTTHCLAKNSTDLTSPNCPDNAANITDVNSSFLRKITLSGSGGPCSVGERVTAVVSWADGKCSAATPFCHNVTLDSCVAEVDNVSGP